MATLATEYDISTLAPAVEAAGIEFGDTINASDIRLALRAFDIEPGEAINDSDVRLLLRKYVETLPGIDPGEVNPVADNIFSGERTIEQAAEKFGGPASGGGEGGTTDDDPGSLPGVLAGGETIRVRTDGMERWYQVYEFPPGSGNFISYQYNDRSQVEATVGDGFDFQSRSLGWFEENVAAEASAEEVIGLEGTFQGLSREMMRDAAQEAGISDPGLVGRIASNPEMQNIMVQAISGDWSPERILAAQRQTNFWKTELYPGIDKFYNQTQEPERAWSEYRRNVSPALKQLGYEPGPDGTFKGQIGEMLNREIDDEIFVSQVPTFVRAQQNAEFAGVLNQWAERELGREVEFNDWFDLMSGESAPELEGVAERAMLAYRDQEAGTGVGTGQIERLAERTDLSDAQAQQLFSQYGRDVLALGDVGLRRGNLSRDEVLSALAGVDPGTGRSIEEVRLQVAKIAKEEGLFDDEKASFFVGFDESGTPRRPGLQALTPEGA